MRCCIHELTPYLRYPVTHFAVHLCHLFTADLAAAERAERAACDRRRAFLNSIQPRKVPRLTAVGFHRTRLPEAAFTALRTYHDQFVHTALAPENFPRTDCVLNAHEAPTSLLQTPHDINELVVQSVRPILAEWIGVSDPSSLESTAVYGIRVYHNGSRLLNHVDRVQTHAVSAIIQVAQQVSQEWELDIFDHAGSVHAITMCACAVHATDFHTV